MRPCRGRLWRGSWSENWRGLTKWTERNNITGRRRPKTEGRSGQKDQRWNEVSTNLSQREGRYKEMQMQITDHYMRMLKFLSCLQFQYQTAGIRRLLVRWCGLGYSCTVTEEEYWKSLTFVCLFVYLFDCTSRFANFARGKWPNHDSKNYIEIRTVKWSVIWLWKLQFTINRNHWSMIINDNQW